MSATHTDVPAQPSVVTAPLPVPVPLDEHQECPVTDVLRRMGDRWSVLVLVLLGRAPHRYNELRRALDGVSQRMLTRTLQTLREEGFVRREVRDTVPPSVTYSLTPLGRSFLEPLSAVADWAVRHQAELGRPRAD